MMSFNLENVFQRIAASEEESKCHSTQLEEVRKENAAVVTDLQHAWTDLLSYNGNLNNEIRRLVDVSIRSKCLTGKLSVLERQRDSLTAHGERLREDLASAAAEASLRRECFEKEVDEFSAGYDLYGDGQKRRELSAKAEIKQLESDINALGKEVESLSELKSATMNSMSKQQQIRELNALCMNETAAIEDLVHDKETLSQLPLADQEYIRLTSELDSIRDCSHLETRCKELQQQLQQLHQSGWRHRLQ